MPVSDPLELQVVLRDEDVEAAVLEGARGARAR